MNSTLKSLKQSRAWRTIHRTYERWAEEDGDQRAAALAYYLLLSLLPLVLVLVALGTLFLEHETVTQEIVKLINNHIPMTSEQESWTVDNIRDWLNARGRISLAALPFLIWGSMKYLRTLIKTTNRLWRVENYNWWKLPLKSLALLGITASAVLIGMVVPAVAGSAAEALATQLDFPQWILSVIFNAIPGLVLFYGLIMIYRLAPSRPTRFADVWLGALIAAILLWLSERLFLLYLANLTNFDAIYGALSGVVAFLLWLYLACCIAVLGICFCAAQTEVRDED